MLSKRHRLLMMVILVLAYLARLIPGARTVDDAYITYRYARNILSGAGMVYNPGERVLGTTTPLYTGLLALFGLLGGGPQAPFPQISMTINALADVLSCALLYALGRRLGQPRAGLIAAALWAVAPMSVTFAIGGMETSLFVLLMLATLYWYSQERPVATGGVAALATLTRPDALLFLLPLAGEWLRRGISLRPLRLRLHRLPARAAAAYAIPLLPWALFASVYFGSPLPNSIPAKSLAYSQPQGAALIRLLQHFATPFMGHETFGIPWIRLGILLFPALYILGAVTTVRRQPAAWPLFAFPPFYLLAYALANPLLFRWYLTPPLPLYFLGILLGLERLADDLPLKGLPWLFAAGAFGLLLNAWTLRPDHGPYLPAPKMAYIRLELLYEQVGRDLAQQVQEDEIVAAGDIGALGYFSNAPILDTVGLVSPQVADYFPLPPGALVINYAIPSQMIRDERPDWIVFLEVYARNTLLQDRWFLEHYTLERALETDIYGSRGMLIYRWSGSDGP